MKNCKFWSKIGKNIEKNDIYYRAEGAKKFLRNIVKNIRGDPYDFFSFFGRMGGGETIGGQGGGASPPPTNAAGAQNRQPTSQIEQKMSIF